MELRVGGEAGPSLPVLHVRGGLACERTPWLEGCDPHSVEKVEAKRD